MRAAAVRLLEADVDDGLAAVSGISPRRAKIVTLGAHTQERAQHCALTRRPRGRARKRTPLHPPSLRSPRARATHDERLG